MYLLGILLYVICLVSLSALGGNLSYFLNLPSLVIILALTLPMLLASGLLSDFLKGFSLMVKKVNLYSAIDLKRILEADKLAIQSLAIAGFVGTITGMIAILANLSEPVKLGPSLSVAFITVLYSLIFISLILPVRAKVSSILVTLEQEQVK